MSLIRSPHWANAREALKKRPRKNDTSYGVEATAKFRGVERGIDFLVSPTVLLRDEHPHHLDFGGEI